ncbi:MAG: putative transcriptional regulator, ArsR family [Rhizobium sp.]|nr:putative transcriptional regulator, ArsR family [Rhizobium sp.]
MDTLSATLSALADPTRRGLLAQLALGEATVGDLAEPYEMSLAAVSKHLKVLEHAGLVTRGRTAQYRPCRLDAKPMKEALDYLSSYRRFWEENFSRLDALLEEMKADTENPGKDRT